MGTFTEPVRAGNGIRVIVGYIDADSGCTAAGAAHVLTAEDVCFLAPLDEIWYLRVCS
jgi:hypothetical protein